MSVNQVTEGGSGTQTIDQAAHDALVAPYKQILDSSAVQYNGFEEWFSAFCATYDNYLEEGGGFESLKAQLRTALNAVKAALDALDKALEGYDETAIDEAMKALASAIAVMQSKKGFVEADMPARIQAYNELKEVKNQIGGDYAELLKKLNDTSNAYNVTIDNFKDVLEVAKYRKSYKDSLDSCSSVNQNSKYVELKGLLYNDQYNICSFLSEEAVARQEYVKRLGVLDSGVKDVWSSKAFADNTTHVATQTATLSMKVMQANNAYRDIESQMEAEINLEAMAQKNENLKRLRDEGIWRGTKSQRRQEILQEEALQKARNAESEAERKNI